MSTPNYVITAINFYIKQKDSKPLIELFTKGIPLHTYPESRALIVKLLQGKKVRNVGRQKLTLDKKDIHEQAIVFMAQIHGAGLPEYGGEKTACRVAAERYGMKHSTLLKMWKGRKKKGDELITHNIETGKQNPEFLWFI